MSPFHCPILSWHYLHTYIFIVSRRYTKLFKITESTNYVEKGLLINKGPKERMTNVFPSHSCAHVSAFHLPKKIQGFRNFYIFYPYKSMFYFFFFSVFSLVRKAHHIYQIFTQMSLHRNRTNLVIKRHPGEPILHWAFPLSLFV